MTADEIGPGGGEVKRRPGGRSAAVRAAVRDATFALLEEVGYERLQLPDIAVRAGVNKTTLYRRWPTKQDLVAELLGDLAARYAPTPDTGTLVGDLEILLAEVAQVLRMRAVQATIRSVMELSDEDVRARDARTAFWNQRFAHSTAIVERAVGRGELPADTDARRYLEQVFGPLYLRMLIIGEEVDEVDIAAMARRTATRRPTARP